MPSPRRWAPTCARSATTQSETPSATVARPSSIATSRPPSRAEPIRSPAATGSSGAFVSPWVVAAAAGAKVPRHVGVVAGGGLDLRARVDPHDPPTLARLGGLGAEPGQLRTRPRPQPVA